VAPGELSVAISGVRSPGTGSRSFVIETGDSMGYVIDLDPNVTVSAPSGTMTNLAVEVQAAGVSGDVQIELTTTGQVPPDGTLEIVLPARTYGGYPSPFVPGAVGIYQQSGMIAADTLNVAVSGQTVILSGFDSALQPGAMSFTLQNVRSPGSILSESFTFQSRDSDGNLIDVVSGEDSIGATPRTNELYSTSVRIPNSGHTGAVNVSFATVGTVLSGGKIRVGFPKGFVLPSDMAVTMLSTSVVSRDTDVDVTVDVATNAAVVGVHGDIPQGFVAFTLHDVTTPVGLSAVAFEISTSDSGGFPDRVFDRVVHRLVNPVDLEVWWDGDAAMPAAYTMSS